MGQRIAYLVLAHGDPVHLGRLLRAIDHRADFFVHVDAKTELEAFLEQPLPTSTTFLQPRREVHWADISMVDALIDLMEAAIARAADYSHLVILSGSDYPLRPARAIHEFFTSQPDRQFVKYIDMRESAHYLKCVDSRWFKKPLWISPVKVLNYPDKVLRRAGNLLGLPNKWRTDVVTPYTGSTWMALTPRCCEYILTYHRTNRWYYDMNRFTFAPDEHYFHSIIGNSPFSSQADGLQPFVARGLWRLANFHHIHPSLAKWYTLDDWNEVASSKAHFIRKLNSTSGGPLVEAIDERLLAP